MTTRIRRGGWTAALIAAAAWSVVSLGAGPVSAAEPGATAAHASFLGRLASPVTVASTVPDNGDVNPYGTAVVPATTGKLVQGAVLVSNFNNQGNEQGTGSTIVEITPGGQRRLFASVHLAAGQACPGGVGLTTALAVFRSGWVVVGSLPTGDGTIATAQAGCLIVLDSSGHVAETVAGGPINGPWDLTSIDRGSTAVLFVSNVLNGTVAADPNPAQPGMVVHRGTVVRLGLRFGAATPAVTGEQVIASGFGERGDPGALVVGPTGLGMLNGTLYVADTAANGIDAVPDALGLTTPLTGIRITRGGALNSPLGLAMAPNGDIVTVNGGDGNAVETTPAGVQVATKALDTTPQMGAAAGAGALFGLAVAPGGTGLYVVDDISNSLDVATRN
ncbi:MAG TPA: hypothetical protein VHT30_01650 [Acidimicrobiales bacterium]|jgi:hypothetical protein|nr:hypothetical protein [Acidimicrobiales bacterium]